MGLTPLHFPSPPESSNFLACQSKLTSFHLVHLAPATPASLLLLKHISHLPAPCPNTLAWIHRSHPLIDFSFLLRSPHSSLTLCELAPPPPASLSIDLLYLSVASTHYDFFLLFSQHFPKLKKKKSSKALPSQFVQTISLSPSHNRNQDQL